MVRIHFEIMSKYEQKGEPVSVAIPFPKGKADYEDLSRFSIRKGGELYPAQYKVTADWEDGSIKWLLINFLADLPANKAVDYWFCQEDVPIRPLSPIVFVKDGHLLIDTGSVRAVLNPAGSDHIFSVIEAGGCLYDEKAVTGPYMIDKDNRQYRVHIGDEGWDILEEGPVRAVLRTKGKHYDDQGKSWFDYNLFIYAYRNKPWFKFDYQFINCEEDKAHREHYNLKLNAEAAGFKYSKDYAYEDVKGIEVRINPGCGKENRFHHTLFTSSFHYTAEKKTGDQRLYHQVSADTIIHTANEMFPEVLFSIYALDWQDEKHALTAGVYQAYQNFPKAIESSGDGIVLKLMPPEYGEMLKVPQGAARTSRFHLSFRTQDMTEDRIVDRELLFQRPVVPVLDPQVYIDAGVFGSLVSKQYHHSTERFLFRYVDSRAKGLGMMNFGDGPEWEYMKQGRSEGLDVWINNEYDMPHNFMLMLARTGDSRYYDYLKASTEHWYDVDFCHYSQNPDKYGLLYTHSVDHVTGQPVPSHQWVEGFLDYYHLTGNNLAYEAAMTIGNRLIELLKLPLYQTTGKVEPREIGWAMRTFLALYQETHEERWLDACQPIVEVYIEWANAYGSWTSPYPDNHLARVPFMINVGVVGLIGYYRLRPDERIKETVLAVINEMMEECYVERAGTFYGKQSPAVRYLNLNGMVLQSLAIAYELTGDRKYIDAGMGMFQWISVENLPPVYDFSKIKRDAFTVIYNCPVGPKRCAQSLIPFLHFYKYVMELGILEPGF